MQRPRNSLSRFLPYLLLVPAGLAGALALFWFMQWMIMPAEGFHKRVTTHHLVDFVRVKEESTAPEQKRRAPPEPKPEEMPKMRTPMQTTADRAQQQNLPPQPVRAELPNLGGATGFAKGPALPLAPTEGDAELTPLVSVPPQYPPRARRMGIEGHVKARLRVDAEGIVQSVEIVESVPPGQFDRSVLRTLKRWKFKPKVVDGTPMAHTGTVTIQFTLEQ